MQPQIQNQIVMTQLSIKISNQYGMKSDNHENKKFRAPPLHLIIYRLQIQIKLKIVI